MLPVTYKNFKKRRNRTREKFAHCIFTFVLFPKNVIVKLRDLYYAYAHVKISTAQKLIRPWRERKKKKL